MFTKAVPATSLFRSIRRLLGVLESPITDASRLLPAPVTAATWEPQRHPCPVCGEEMTKNLAPLHPNDPPYFCVECSKAVANEARQQLETIRSRSSKLHLPTGTLNRMYRTVAAGTYARDMYHARQQQALSEAEKNIIAALQTKPSLKDTPESADVAQLATAKPQRHNTGPLPARDIVLENTPPREPDVSQMITIHPVPNPATPIPMEEARQDLFADVPDIAYEEEDEEVTERRKIVRKVTRETRQMRAEAMLEAMLHGKASEQSTGENEQIAVGQVNWML